MEVRGNRGSAWLIVAAALLPLVLFLIFQIGYSAREQRRSTEARALARSETVVLGSDARVARISAAVDALATARSLRSGNLTEFADRARELAALSGEWRGIQLIDPASGKAILSIGAVPTRLEKGDRPMSPDRTSFGGFAWGPGCPCLVFERPAASSNGRPLQLRVFVSADPLLRLLPSVHSEYPVSAISGQKGYFIARSLKPAERFGTLGSKYLVGAVKSGKRQGIYRGFTLEGLENYTAFTRSEVTGWTAHIALGSQNIDTPARRYFASLGFAALVSLLLATLLIVFAVRQLSQARQFTQRMQQAQKLEALGQLTGGIAHDFNNLLTPIVGALDFLSKKPELDARARRLADGALSAARRAGKLTAQLLTFSRRQKLHIGPLALDPIMAELADLFDQSVGDTHRVQVDISRPGLGVLSDASQLELAVLNLVINARDASAEGSTIDVTVREDVDNVAIAVADQGVGMDEITRLRAIEPFFSTKAVGRGTGLGLSQAYAVAEQSGGLLSISSIPGEGTVVTLTLRRCELPEDTELAPAGAKVEGAHSPCRLLVVDDEPAVRAAVVRPLEDAGHLVDSVSDGETALAALAQRKFDLILVDFSMPGMDGATLIGKARALTGDTPFLMVTGFADSDAVAELAPDVPILKKPFEPDELAALVHSILSR